MDDVVTEDLRPPGVGREQRGEHPDERCLPGAIRAEQSEHLALLNVEVHPGERDGRAEVLRHALNMNCGSRGAVYSHARSRPYPGSSELYGSSSPRTSR